MISFRLTVFQKLRIAMASSKLKEKCRHPVQHVLLIHLEHFAHSRQRIKLAVAISIFRNIKERLKKAAFGDFFPLQKNVHFLAFFRWSDFFHGVCFGIKSQLFDWVFWGSTPKKYIGLYFKNYLKGRRLFKGVSNHDIVYFWDHTKSSPKGPFFARVLFFTARVFVLNFNCLTQNIGFQHKKKNGKANNRRYWSASIIITEEVWQLVWPDIYACVRVICQ